MQLAHEDSVLLFEALTPLSNGLEHINAPIH